MEPLQFVYWLQGFMELADVKKLNEKQVQVLKDHIALVLTKKTPDYEKASYPDEPKQARWIDPKLTCTTTPGFIPSSPDYTQVPHFIPQFQVADEFRRANGQRLLSDVQEFNPPWPNGTIASC